MCSAAGRVSPAIWGFFYERFSSLLRDEACQFRNQQSRTWLSGNHGSIYGGQAAFPGGSLYHASKWGLEGFLDSIAQEVAAFQIGVRNADGCLQGHTGGYGSRHDSGYLAASAGRSSKDR